LFAKTGEQVQLGVVAVWADGVREDVTPLCRFHSNSDTIATVSKEGLVTAGDPGDTHVVVFYDNGVVPIPAIRPVSDKVGKAYPQVAAPTKIDELVVGKLRKLGIVQSETCSDAEFLRRVSLDMTGTLPTAEQVEKFLASPSPNKRSEKIEELLSSPGYAAWWTTKLCDYTGNSDTQLVNILPNVRGNSYSSPGQAWYDWIHQRVEKNTPYDDLVAGIVTATSRREGQSYTEYCAEMSGLCQPNSDKSFADLDSMPFYWARRDFREIEAQTITFAYAFMGVRIQCAQCHKHPFDQWTKDDFAQFQNFFGRTQLAQAQGRGPEAKEYQAIIEALGVKGEQRGNQLRQQFGQFLAEGKTVPFPELVVTGFRGRRNGDNSTTTTTDAKLLGGESFDLSKVRDPREPLMDWLRSKDNPYFAKAFVNRVWANYFNVGIVEPPDDLSLANAPSNKELLDYLAAGFINSGFDMKWVHREIANSRTYQLSWQTNDTNVADERNFSRAVPRRLPAEVAYDALQIATASDAKANRLHTDLEGRAIAMASPPRNNNGGGGAGAQYALTVFGRSTRESNCDCDRSMESSLLQTVYLQNDSDVLAMVDGARDGWISQISRELDPRGASAGREDDRESDRGGRELSADDQRRIEQARQRIAQLRKDGKDDEARALERRLAVLSRGGDRRRGDEQPEAKPESKPEATSTAEGKPADAKRLVELAYLRTVSRYPDASEAKRSLEHVESAGDTVRGIKDLLWALVNTKEFILNH
jgi:hypothetical protein